MFRAQNRYTGHWLASPHRYKDGDAIWPQSRDERDAHEFKTRKEARDTIKDIEPNALEIFKIVGRKGL